MKLSLLNRIGKQRFTVCNTLPGCRACRGRIWGEVGAYYAEIEAISFFTGQNRNFCLQVKGNFRLDFQMLILLLFCYIYNCTIDPFLTRAVYCLPMCCISDLYLFYFSTCYINILMAAFHFLFFSLCSNLTSCNDNLLSSVASLLN